MNVKKAKFLLTTIVAFFILFAFALPFTRSEVHPEIISPKDKAPMVFVPEGKFMYGIKASERRNLLKELNEEPVDFYSAELDEAHGTTGSYYIDRFEVTNERYAKFVNETGHLKPSYWAFARYSDPQLPVVGIGWDDAKEYCAWAGKRLPTEFEWEKAARGTDGRIWPWGNRADDKKYNGRYMAKGSAARVGSFPDGNSPYGVSDMAGNVWEMTSSKWPSEDRPSGMLMKGGSFLNTNGDVRAMVRWAPEDEQKGATWLGFRCVKPA